ncbi:hypothetical protein LB517_28370 [Mesorhizobium sp. BR1-1-12]|uniref:hypothetical protein n=1 Tax=Mesorhizobium sp. BR1-1-12 TaxID=2876657 RepID=UPI001CD12BCB|nr:hypothetical protein [Mesorhizobium sp. BR1-1-12]MBZ9973550.1 hypothetical protein [Mesorhizobium sp. BR1-1-12]
MTKIQTAERFTDTGGNGYPQRTHSTKTTKREAFDVCFDGSFGHWMPELKGPGYPRVRHLPGATTQYGGFATLEAATQALDDLYAA